MFSHDELVFKLALNIKFDGNIEFVISKELQAIIIKEIQERKVVQNKVRTYSLDLS